MSNSQFNNLEIASNSKVIKLEEYGKYLFFVDPNKVEIAKLEDALIDQDIQYIIVPTKNPESIVIKKVEEL